MDKDKGQVTVLGLLARKPETDSHEFTNTNPSEDGNQTGQEAEWTFCTSEEMEKKSQHLRQNHDQVSKLNIHKHRNIYGI